MIDYLVDERGYTREQAYAICSVAVDLKISEVVDVPNFVVSGRPAAGHLRVIDAVGSRQ